MSVNLPHVQLGGWRGNEIMTSLKKVYKQLDDAANLRKEEFDTENTFRRKELNNLKAITPCSVGYNLSQIDAHLQSQYPGQNQFSEMLKNERLNLIQDTF